MRLFRNFFLHTSTTWHKVEPYWNTKFHSPQNDHVLKTSVFFGGLGEGGIYFFINQINSAQIYWCHTTPYYYIDWMIYSVMQLECKSFQIIFLCILCHHYTKQVLVLSHQIILSHSPNVRLAWILVQFNILNFCLGD